ncbi:S8 family serine peptidase [Shewanella sp. 125m-1]
MFKVKPLTVVTLSALYTAGVAATANPLVDRIAPSIEQSVLAVQPRIETKFSGKVNQHIKKQHKIFVAERGITGVHTYIVQLSDAPVSSYQGGVKGFVATNNKFKKMIGSGTGKGIDLNHSTVKSYVSFLKSKQQNLLENASAQKSLSLQMKRSFSIALNAFSVEMTQEQAKQLADVAGVKHISRSIDYKISTNNTAEQTGASAIWAGDGVLMPNQGEGIIVGVIDTGINSDHPSFADKGDDGYQIINPYGNGIYKGDCVTNASLCNSKLVGVYSYPEITDEYPHHIVKNGEDYNGHGSHTAGTAVGNILYDVPFTVPEMKTESDGKQTEHILPQVSGMAPHANLIAYQVCGAVGGCPTEAIISAIEDAIIDGVDVINASLGAGADHPYYWPMQTAFLNAAHNGIFVAAAAGNSGFEFTASNSSPWITTVGGTTANMLSTLSRLVTNFSASSDYGDHPFANYVGEAYPDPLGSSLSGSISGPLVQPMYYDERACEQAFAVDTFTSDQIVLCSMVYGTTMTPLDISDNVKAGGAGGVIVANWHNGADSQWQLSLPGIVIGSRDGGRISSWLDSWGTTDHQVTITESSVNHSQFDETFSYQASSRGPSAFLLNTLVVDIAAPAVKVYAPFADQQLLGMSSVGASDWANISGTSMATPHIAGIAALIAKSNPQWSVMELQSAMISTANQDVYEPSWGSQYEHENIDYKEKSQLQDIGNGQIDAVAAINAGLVLDESMENMEKANPDLGGDMRNLNTAYMVNLDCYEECSFLRTVKATKTGSWSATHERIRGNYEIDIIPSDFTLAAGEEQAIVIKAKRNAYIDSGFVGEDIFGNQGRIVLTPTDSSIPTTSLPYWTDTSADGLPDFVAVNAHRSSGTFTLKGIQTKETTEFTTRSYGMVKATPKTIELTTGVDNPFDELNREHTHTELYTVTENQKLLAVHTTGEDKNGFAIFLGEDSNGDGVAQEDEMICLSSAYESDNFCALIDPQAGNYWAVFASTLWGDEKRDLSFVSAMVGDDKQNLVATGPSSTNGHQAYDIKVQYDIQDMNVGDMYFGGFEVGSNPQDFNNIGFVPILIQQEDEAISFEVSKNRVKSGDIIDFKISYLANLTSQDREFAIDLSMPVGFEIIPDSIKSSSNTPMVPELNGQQLTLVGTQQTGLDIERNYVITTSEDDPYCAEYDYVNLSEHGWRPIEGLEGEYYDDWFRFELKDLLETDDDSLHIPFFGVNKFTSVKINPAGFIQFDDSYMPYNHVEFPQEVYPGQSTGKYVIAPYWIGDHKTTYLHAEGDNRHEEMSGVSVSYTDDREYMLIEWDNVTRTGYGNEGHNVDFETFIRTNISYNPGDFEMVFSYNNLNQTDGQGSIGFHNYFGLIVNYDTPFEKFEGDSYAFNDLEHKLSNNLAVCMDYTGPEQTGFDVTFSANIREAAAGKTHELVFTDSLAGAMAEVKTVSVEVTANIVMNDLHDQTVAEGETASFEVLYHDANKVSNHLAVNIDESLFIVNISEHASGGTVNITPVEEDYTGSASVTVMVKDNESEFDIASDTVTLTYTNVNDAPVAMVADSDITIIEGNMVTLDASASSDIDAGDSLSYLWHGPGVISDVTSVSPSVTGLAIGSHSFEVTVSDKVGETATASVSVIVNAKANAEEPPAESDESSGGALSGWLLLMLSSLLLYRRR